MGRFAVGKYAFMEYLTALFQISHERHAKRVERSLVGKDEYEPKHPQLEPKENLTDAEALKDARPDRTEPAVTRILDSKLF